MYLGASFGYFFPMPIQSDSRKGRESKFSMTSIAILLERLHEKKKQGVSLDEHCAIARNLSEISQAPDKAPAL